MRKGMRWGALMVVGALGLTGCDGGQGKGSEAGQLQELPQPTVPPTEVPPTQPPTTPPTPPPPPPPPPPTTPPPPPPPPTTPPPPPPVKVEATEPGTSAGWAFFGAEAGGPTQVLGVSADAGGNIWVAGGEEGLFLLKKGETTFRRFTMADGLRPYGFLPEGGTPVGDKYLNVLSVAGGPAGTVFVGYKGKDGCETNWDKDGPGTGDPNIYKSGDADRVELKSDGTLRVVHYDIFSGPEMVSNEREGRERICSVYRVVYDNRSVNGSAPFNRVWFGGNHGFAAARANYEYTRKADGNWCNGDYTCSGIEEHSHPAFNGWNARYATCAETADANLAIMSWYYPAIALDPSGDVWVGGWDRSTRFKFYTAMTRPYFWEAQKLTDLEKYELQFDIWKDRAPSCRGYTLGSDRVDDAISGVAVRADGTVWMTSYGTGREGDPARGLARLDGSGKVLQYLTEGLTPLRNASLAADPRDDSLWVGGSGGGLNRLRGSTLVQYRSGAIGSTRAGQSVVDIQVAGSGPARMVLVAFKGSSGAPGSIGVYTGD